MSLRRAFSSLKIFRKRKYDEPDKETEEVIEEKEPEFTKRIRLTQTRRPKLSPVLQHLFKSPVNAAEFH